MGAQIKNKVFHNKRVGVFVQLYFYKRVKLLEVRIAKKKKRLFKIYFERKLLEVTIKEVKISC